MVGASTAALGGLLVAASIAPTRPYEGPQTVELPPADAMPPIATGPSDAEPPSDKQVSPDPASDADTEAAGDSSSASDRRPRVLASLRDGFGVESADGRFGALVGFFGQLRYFVENTDTETTHGFRLRVARPMLTAHLWGDRLQLFAQPELAGSSVTLLDAMATINVHPAFGLVLGQYRPWYTRAFPTPLPALLLTDRGPVVDALGVDRDLGVTLFGQPFDGRLEYYAAVLNGEGPNALTNANPHFLYIGRIGVAPLGAVAYDQSPAVIADRPLPFRFAVAAKAYTNELDQSAVVVDATTGQEVEIALPDLREIGVGGDVAVRWDRISAEVEGLWRRRLRDGGPDTHAWGVQSLLGVLVVRERLDLAMRVSVEDIEGDGLGTVVPIEPGMNIYFVRRNARLTLHYRCDVPAGSSTCALHRAIVQAQLLF